MSAPNVIVESVKRAEDGPELIVRLYESEGTLTDATVRFGFPVRSAAEVNLLEEPERGLAVVDDAIRIRFQPRAICSLRLEC